MSPFMPSTSCTLKTITSILLCIASLIVLLCSSASSRPSLFRGYSVLYVQKECSELSVEHFLAEAGCEDVIRQGTLRSLPLPQDMLSPMTGENGDIAVYSLAKMFDAYLEGRKGYFASSDGKYALYYVKSAGQKKKLRSVVSSINKEFGKNIRCGIIERQYHIIFLIIAVLFALLLCILSKRIILYLPPIILVARMPAASITLCALLMLCALFFARSLWQRPHSVRTLIKSLIFPLLMFSSAVLLFIGGALNARLQGGIIGGIAAFTLSIFAMRTQYLLKKMEESRHFFSPVPILLSRRIERGGGISIIAGCVLSGIVCFISMGGSALKEAAYPVGGGDKGYDIKIEPSLPNVDDYCAWCWQCLTYPYTRLGGEDEAIKEKIVFPTYKESGGIITEDIKEIRRDDAFRLWCIDRIDDLPSWEVEHLMKSRTDDKTESLGAEGKESGTFFSVVTTIIAFLLCLFSLVHNKQIKYARSSEYRQGILNIKSSIAM